MKDFPLAFDAVGSGSFTIGIQVTDTQPQHSEARGGRCHKKPESVVSSPATVSPAKFVCLKPFVVISTISTASALEINRWHFNKWLPFITHWPQLQIPSVVLSLFSPHLRWSCESLEVLYEGRINLFLSPVNADILTSSFESQMLFMASRMVTNFQVFNLLVPDPSEKSLQ